MTPVPEFRLAGRSDLEAIVGLLNDDELGRARNPLFAEHEAGYRAAFEAILAQEGNGYVVAESAGRVVGCYQLTFIRGLSHRGGERAQIESVRIALDLRGGGLGSMMMGDAMERARDRGCFMVQLTTDMQRTHTKRFYERLGFTASHHGMKLHLS